MGNWFSVPDDEFCLKQREKARHYDEKRETCLQQSSEASQRGDDGAAGQLSMDAERYKKLMKEANRRAADAIYRHFNAAGKQPDDTIDLHGLYVAEALEKLQEAVNAARRNKTRSLVVIVGRGIHSVDGIPKIKLAVLEFAKRNAQSSIKRIRLL